MTKSYAAATARNREPILEVLPRELVAMPANNLSVVFRRLAAHGGAGT